MGADRGQWRGDRAPQTAPDTPQDRVAAPDLSPRARDILHQLAGHSTTRMAAALALSTNTVRGHIQTLRRKLTAPNRDGIVGRARDLGLL
ncbi:response regulator transcription factor [Geodermatophilus sp. SYSU D00705]